MLAKCTGTFAIGRVQLAWGNGGQPKSDHLAFSRRHGQPIVSRGLCPGLLWVHRVGLPADDEAVDAVLDERRPVLSTEQPLRVRFVLSEQQGSRAVTIEIAFPQIFLFHLNHGGFAGASLKGWPW